LTSGARASPRARLAASTGASPRARLAASTGASPRARLAASVCLPARVRRSGCVATAFVVSRIVPAAQSNTAKARERNRNQVGNPHWFYFTASGNQRRAGKSNSFYR
jgi:hypothetical protein